MIFDEIVKNTRKGKGFEDEARIIVNGVNSYRRKIIDACFPEGVPDPEIPFFLAALRLTFDDFEGIAKRSENHDTYMNAVNDIVDVVNECTRSITITREVENG